MVQSIILLIFVSFLAKLIHHFISVSYDRVENRSHGPPILGVYKIFAALKIFTKKKKLGKQYKYIEIDLMELLRST